MLTKRITPSKSRSNTEMRSESNFSEMQRSFSSRAYSKVSPRDRMKRARNYVN